MSGKIPKTFLNELLNRVDIVEVIDQRVALKNTGKNYKACCPFHTEKTPSFTVSHTKQFYHCFGCGANGNAIGFVMEFDRVDFVDAVEILAAMLGLTIPYEKMDHHTARFTDESKALYDILQRAATFYQQALRSHAEKEQAIDYLKARGLSGEIAKRFAIGYAPSGWENFYQIVKDLDSKTLLNTGLFIEKQAGKCYDRFRHRIMFPIRDRRGRCIGFGGRVLDKDEEPKYLNSPETPVFHKRQSLYGIYEALQSNRELKRLLVVEGYMDVVALAQFGINYAVATLGTATTPEHIQQLFRHTSHIIFCFDGDNAGRQAAWKAMENLLPLLEDGLQAHFMFLPDTEDPDSLIRKIGKEAFEELIDQAKTASQFFFQHMSADIDMTSLDGHAKLVKVTTPYIKQIPGKVLQHMMLDNLAKWANMDMEKLGELTGIQTKVKNIAKSTPLLSVNPQKPTLMQQAITMLLQHPHLAQTLEETVSWKHLQIPGSQILQQLLDLLLSDPNIHTGAILEQWRDNPEFSALNKLASLDLIVPDTGLEAEFKATLRKLQNNAIEKLINELHRQAEQGNLTDQQRRLYMDLLNNRSASRIPN